jgi:hypothetical protein
MVFLSYAKEDIGSVQRLYATFAEAGIVAWMDAPPEPYRHLGIILEPNGRRSSGTV